jgi:hypothetical protein
MRLMAFLVFLLLRMADLQAPGSFGLERLVNCVVVVDASSGLRELGHFVAQ